MASSELLIACCSPLANKKIKYLKTPNYKMAKSKKEKLKDLLHTIHVLDKFDDSLEVLKKRKEVKPAHYKQIKALLIKEHKKLSAELEEI